MKKTGKVIMGVLLALALTVSGFAGVAQAEEVQAADDVCTVAFAPNAADAVGFTPAQAIPKNTPTALNINGFSRTGYTFLGWNTSPGGDGIGFANGQVVTLETGMTLFAQWSAPAASEKDSKEEKKEKEPAGEGTVDKQDKTPAAGEDAPAEGDPAPAEEPKVEAPAEDGEPVVTEPAEEEKKEETPAAEEVTEEDDDVEEAAPSEAPAQLDGEKDEEAVTEEAVEEEAEEKEEDEPEEVAEAEPEAALEKAPEKVKISFDANGGKGSMEAVEVEKGKDYTLPKSTFTKPSGKEFDSWDKGAVGDKIKADKDMTIKAMWNVQVSFDANGRGKAPSAQTVVVGSKAKEPKALSAKGYTFTGWYTDKKCTKEFDFSAKVADAVKLYAGWRANKYTIHFDANKGSGNMDDLKCTYDKAATLTKNAFVRTDYEFIGWNTKADRTGTAYANAAEVKNLTDEDGAKITLYAQWKFIYKVLYGINGAVSKQNTQGYTFRTNGDVSLFAGVKVDGKPVDSKYYTYWSGSTYVNLKQTYIRDLAIGSHTIEFLYQDGSCSTVFSVNNNKVIVPVQTGDSNNMSLWMGLIIAAAVCIAAMAWLKRREMMGR